MRLDIDELFSAHNTLEVLNANTLEVKKYIQGNLISDLVGKQCVSNGYIFCLGWSFYLPCPSLGDSCLKGFRVRLLLPETHPQEGLIQ